MSTYINPFLFTQTTYDRYSMGFTASTTTALQISATTNAIDTVLRDTSPTFTVSCWVKLTSNPNDGGGFGNMIFSKYRTSAAADRCFYMSVHSNRTVELYGTSGGSTGVLYRVTTATLPSGLTTWNHLAFVYNSNKSSKDEITRLFINGVSASSWSTDTVAITGAKRFVNQTVAGNRGLVQWGSSNDTTTPQWNGRIDECTFWKTALTNSEIVTYLYNNGTPGQLSGMTAYTP